MDTSRAVKVKQREEVSSPKSKNTPGNFQNKQSSEAGAQERPSFAETLLLYEDEVRKIEDEKELLSHFVNSGRALLHFRQAFVFKKATKNSEFRLKAVSSLSTIESNAPFVKWIEKVIKNLDDDNASSESNIFTLPAYCDESDEETKKYPFPELCWCPLKDNEHTFGGILISKEVHWTQAEQSLCSRFSRLYAHAWRSIKGRNKTLKDTIFTKKTLIGTLCALTLISFIPIPITALAPVEVTPANPYIVTAPFKGVVKEILVDQNSNVKKGEAIVQLEDVRLRNEYEIADQNEAVAGAKYLRASQSAFSDVGAKHELLIAKAELDLLRAEKEFASELLEKSVLKAERTGIAIYTDKRDWVGRPVSAGEAILQIANPEEIQFEIDLAVKDSVVLTEGTKLKIFLDSDPLNAIDAELLRASYLADKDKRDIMSYKLIAVLNDVGDKPIPRIGIQGTAQIKSKTAPLIFSVLRRPLSTLRQFTGW